MIIKLCNTWRICFFFFRPLGPVFRPHSPLAPPPTGGGGGQCFNLVLSTRFAPPTVRVLLLNPHVRMDNPSDDDGNDDQYAFAIVEVDAMGYGDGDVNPPPLRGNTYAFARAYI